MKKTSQRFQVEIATHEVCEKKVYYYIKVTNIDSKDTKTIKKRYSELESIHFKILDWINIFKIKINNLNFPKKKILFSTNLSEESIIKRRVELQSYFQEIFSHQELQSLGALEEFLPKTSHKKILEQSQNQQSQWSEIEELKRSYLAKHGDQVFSLPTQQDQPQANQQFTFKFEDHTFLDDQALYTIQISDTFTNKRWKFSLRYKDIKDYHRQLKKLKLSFELPLFPEKKVINQLDTHDLKDRKLQLETYLNTIFKYREIVSSDIMVFFIAKSQLDGNEIGCRSKGPSQTTLENSSIQSQTNTNDQYDEIDLKQPRKITC